MAKNLPAMQETRVRSLGREDPLEKGKAGHSSILARRIPRTEEPGGLQSVGSESDTTERLHFFKAISGPVKEYALSGFDPWVGKIPWKGNGNPLQYPCLENLMGSGAWWAAVHGVAKSPPRQSD